MPGAPTLPPALRALLETAGALVRRSASGRVGLARAAPIVDPAALPKALRGLPAQLEAARADACTPVDATQVERTLKATWRAAPGKVLDAWDPEPLAVTAAAQVHRGVRDDGTAVAIKVRREGLAQAVRSDLALLDALAGPLRQVFRAMDAGAVLREVRESALDELDFEHEASTQRQARRVLRDIDGLVVPAPDMELSGDEVLVSELLDGPTLADARPDDPHAAARTLVAAHVAAARAGLALTDARPSHVIVLGGGRIGLLGAGVARPVDRDRVAAALEALAALRAGDEDAFATILAERLGLLSADAARQAYTLALEVLGGLLTGAKKLDAAALKAVGERALKRLDAGLKLAAVVTPQASDVAAARSFGQIAALLARLETTEDWGALVLGK
jgi:predicted unusual protein kinase regulating ubiquinone biosynthesis (AarF/ABC1/UbiB family)